jgi:hypothetical protein
MIELIVYYCYVCGVECAWTGLVYPYRFRFKNWLSKLF